MISPDKLINIRDQNYFEITRQLEILYRGRNFFEMLSEHLRKTGYRPSVSLTRATVYFGKQKGYIIFPRKQGSIRDQSSLKDLKTRALKTNGLGDIHAGSISTETDRIDMSSKKQQKTRKITTDKLHEVWILILLKFRRRRSKKP